MSTSTARAGFILSPLLDDLSKLKAFHSDSAGDVQPEGVTSIRISHASRAGWYFNDLIQIEIFEVRIGAAAESARTATRRP